MSLSVGNSESERDFNSWIVKGDVNNVFVGDFNSWIVKGDVNNVFFNSSIVKGDVNNVFVGVFQQLDCEGRCE